MAEYPAGIEELVGKTTHLVSEVMSENTKIQYHKVAPTHHQLAIGCGCPWGRNNISEEGGFRESKATVQRRCGCETEAARESGLDTTTVFTK